MHIVTIGAFDLLHDGHRELFRYGHALGRGEGLVSVGVNSSAFIRTYKGEPAQTTLERLKSVLACPEVGDAVVHNGDTIATLHGLTGGELAVLLIGSDWHAKDYLGQLGVTLDDLWAIGVMGIVYAHRPADGPSSTKLRAELAEIEDRRESEEFHAACDAAMLDYRARRRTEHDGC